ncbi:MAG: hypothetical protein ACFFBD_24595 [Candidatus Hodarchaeota archaeon]
MTEETVNDVKNWLSTLQKLSSEGQDVLMTIEQTYNVITTQIKDLTEKKNALENDFNMKKSKNQEISQIVEKLEQKKQELANKSQDLKNTLDQKKDQLKTVQNTGMSLKQQIEDVNKLISATEQASKDLEKEKSELDAKRNEMNDRLSSVQAEYNIAQHEIQEAADQLKLIQEQLTELGDISKERIDAARLLEFFRKLIERVFEGGPNTRILLKLHDLEQEKQYKRLVLSEELKIGGAIARRAVFELVNAGLIDFNEEEDTVSLKERLY